MMQTQEQQISVETPYGYSLTSTVILPLGSASGVVLINSATAIPQKFYRKFAGYLAEQGLIAVCYDFHGIGMVPADVEKCKQISMLDWGKKDIDFMLTWASKTYGLSICVVGHSIGGVLLGTARNIDLAKAFVAVSVPTGYWRSWSLMGGGLKVAGVMFGLVPAFSHLFGYFPSHKFGLGCAIPKAVALQAAYWCTKKNFIMHSVSGTDDDHYDKFRGDMLSIVIQDDNWAPAKAVEWMTSHYRQARKSTKLIVPADYGVKRIGHFGIFKEQFKNNIWTCIATWIKQSIGKEPNTALHGKAHTGFP